MLTGTSEHAQASANNKSAGGRQAGERVLGGGGRGSE